MNNIIDRLANTTLSLIVGKRIIDNKFTVYFKDTYISDGCVLIGTSGIGESAEEAAANYYEKIKGKKLIANPSSKTRKEVIVL